MRRVAATVTNGSSVRAVARPVPPQPQCTVQNPITSVLAAGTACLLLLAPVESASAAMGLKQLPPIQESADRCTLGALDKFADTRANFSQEASGGGMTEAFVDVRGCTTFSGKDLRTKTMSGVVLQGADFSKSNLSGAQMARADARGANLSGVDFTDTNAYGTQFDGANLEGAQFENAILSSATFGKFEGNWANLKGAHFEGALLGSSDLIRVCENPTLDNDVRRFELGCRGSR